MNIHLKKIFSFLIKTMVIHTIPGRSLKKKPKYELAIDGFSCWSPVCLLCLVSSQFILTLLKMSLVDDESWEYHVEQGGCSYPIFATKGACHRNPISSRYQLLDQLS